MLFSIIKRPNPNRYFQPTFKGFNGGGRNLLKLIFRFVGAIFVYIARKLKKLVFFTIAVYRFGILFLIGSKAFVVRKLIWSRGRLGRPVVNLIVMGVAFVIFMTGSIFNSSRFVTSQEIDPGYLQNVSDIIPQKNVATTQIPEERRRNVSFNYAVEGGDTLSSIGEKFKISIAALEYVNGITESTVLRVGQELTIPPVAGLIHKVEGGDTLESIAQKYDVPSQAIADFNYILDTSKLAVGTELVVPDAKIPQPPVVIPVAPVFVPSVGDFKPSTGWCVWPTSVRIITQYFSWYHNGLDIATPWGSMPALFACGGGVVSRAGWDPWGLGLHVEIDHGNGYKTVYGHMSRIDVGYGQRVGQGQVIGIMGNTGRSTGPHVHFTVKFNGVPQNPLNYVQ
ncbi:MAG: lipoprotein [candidate division WWE3 bacterium GW2011_GWC1_47_10]|uniref:Lipoprotein n=1 Tax=candidate division WWE3 bacterium GW2011_GWC1_47_10 TaxID=1619122 RepID=A0A0G1R0N8_UNCKA|nr:MAG: lipoprotein [candidate division WWE3 bacterium GW2011_GWC1_47_10]